MIADDGRSLGLAGEAVVVAVMWVGSVMYSAWRRHRADRFAAMRHQARATHPTGRHVVRRRPPFDHGGEP